MKLLKKWILEYIGCFENGLVGLTHLEKNLHIFISKKFNVQPIKQYKKGQILDALMDLQIEGKIFKNRRAHWLDNVKVRLPDEWGGGLVSHSELSLTYGDKKDGKLPRNATFYRINPWIDEEYLKKRKEEYSKIQNNRKYHGEIWKQIENLDVRDFKTALNALPISEDALNFFFDNYLAQHIEPYTKGKLNIMAGEPNRDKKFPEKIVKEYKRSKKTIYCCYKCEEIVFRPSLKYDNVDICLTCHAPNSKHPEGL